MARRKTKVIPLTLVRVMLDLGNFIPIDESFKMKSKELRLALETFKKTTPEKYQRVKEIVVDKKLSNTTASFSDEVKEYVAQAMAGSLEGELQKELMKIATIVEAHEANMEEAIKSAREEIKEEARKEIEQAKKEFITIRVKAGNKKAKAVRGVVPEEFPTMLQLAQERMNIMLVGPAGCGKTYIAGKVAEALDLEFASQSCSAGMSESQLAGWLLPVGKGGNFQYVQSEFIRLYENGGVFLFDEMDAADPNVLIFINQALANGRFSLPQRFDNPVVEKHPDFVAIAATNTFGGGADAMYHARNALDAATLDRFKMGMIPLDYSPTVEESIVDSEVLAWGRAIRNAIKQHGMRKIMSTRVLENATQMKQGQDWTLQEIAKRYFADWTPEEMAVMRRSINAEYLPEV